MVSIKSMIKLLNIFSAIILYYRYTEVITYIYSNQNALQKILVDNFK